MTLIYHLLPPDAWQHAQVDGEYAPPSLAAEGFIHASYSAQILGVANRFYRGEASLVLLAIETSRIEAAVRGDPVTLATGEVVRFPHIYGPLNTDAVVSAVTLTRAADGSFDLPAGLV